MKEFVLNKIDNKTYQIYGEVNGFAFRSPRENNGRFTYQLNYHFFIGKKRINVITGEKDFTISNEKGIIERIAKTIKKEEEKEERGF